MFIPAKRTTLLVPSPSLNDPDRKHLFILLTAPVGEQQEILLVSISSIRDGVPYDSTCVVYPGEHDFVKHPSYVAYSFPKIETAKSLLNGVKLGKLIPMGMMSEGAFTRICDGVLNSRHAPPKIRRLYESSLKG